MMEYNESESDEGETDNSEDSVVESGDDYGSESDSNENLKAPIPALVTTGWKVTVGCAQLNGIR